MPTYPTSEPPSKRTGLYVGLLVVLLLLIAGILFFIGRSLGSATKEVEVPDVIGKSALDASNQLQGAGFKVSTVEQQNDTIPENQVFDQDPKGTVKADEGSTVRIIVSTGVGKVEVPEVTGLSRAAAESLLRNKGFVPNVIEAPNDTVPAGQVISQAPAATTQQDKGSVVNITVSTGLPQVAVPNVAGSDLATASNELGQAGFKVTSTQQSSTSVPAGKVIGTNPAAGTPVQKGATVQVIVSSGPPATTTTTAPPTTTTTTKPPTTTTTT